MIFSIQRFLEDYFHRCGFSDTDQYAMRLAGLYDRERYGKSAPDFLAAMARFRTTFYKRNERIQRRAFEKRVLAVLDREFKKKRVLFVPRELASRIEVSGKLLTKIPRVSIRRFLEEFKKTVESQAVNAFWESRSKQKLDKKAEKRGQEILGVFARGKLAEKGAALREVSSGTGFVDVLLKFSSSLLHVVELKILKRGGVPGIAQLGKYMTHVNRNEGWLVFFDARKSNQRTPIPASFNVASGTIRTVVIEINPVPPHELK